MSPGPVAELVPRRGAYLLILAMMAIYTFGYAFSAVHTDSADELWKAFGIRHGIAYPLEGPPLGGVLHLGPYWFYLTAAPLWVHSSWLASAIFIGFACALKFPLAYACGRRLLDGDFGLLWAAMLLLPGWASFEPLIFLNPNAVGAAGLGVLLLCLHAAGPRAGWPVFFALGVALTLSIHVHPTLAPSALLIAWALWRRGRAGVLPRLLALVAGAVLPLVPYVVSQALHGYPDWRSASTYVEGQVALAGIANVFAVIGHLAYSGPVELARQVLGWGESGAAALGGVVSALCVTSLAALATPSPLARIRALQLLGGLAVFAAGVAMLRTVTPLQFSWVLGAPLGAVAAIGLWALARSGPGRLAGQGALVLTIAFAGYVTFGFAKLLHAGEGALSSRVNDIKGTLPHRLFRDVWFPAWAHGELGRTLCTAGSASLHGHLAYVADKSLGLGAMLECGNRPAAVLAASDAGTHLFGMTRAFWQAAGAAPSCWIGPLGVSAKVTALGPQPGLAIADGRVYLPRTPSGNAPVRTTLDHEAAAGDAVMLTNVLGNYELLRVVSATANGVEAAPVARNDFSYLYRAGAAGGRVAWRFVVEQTNPLALDAVRIDLVATQGETPACSVRAP
jgi:hypothetical protein